MLERTFMVPPKRKTVRRGGLLQAGTHRPDNREETETSAEMKNEYKDA